MINELTSSPSLIISYISFVVIFLLTGLFLIDGRRSGYSKFFIIWLVSTIISGIIVLWLALSPNTVQFITDFFVKIFN